MDVIGLVIPFFSDESYLEEMLRSVVAQTSANWVCLVVDDSGRDSLAESTVQSIGEPRISYVKNESNLGLGRCWNVGLERISRQFAPDVVAVVHADDILDERFVELSLNAHAQYPNAVAVHTSVIVVNELNVKRFSFPDFVKFHLAPYKHSKAISTTGDEGLATILRGNFVFCPTLSFKSELVSLPLYDSSWNMAIDLELIARLLLRGQTIVGIPDVLYRYRRHKRNLTTQLTDSTARFVEEIRLYQKMEIDCLSKGYVKSSKVAHQMTIIRLHILYRLTQKITRLDIKAARKLLKVFASTRS